MIAVGTLYLAWYYKYPPSISGELDLFFCIPIEIGEEYSKCLLFFGEDASQLRRKGIFADICTADIQTITT